MKTVDFWAPGTKVIIKDNPTLVGTIVFCRYHGDETVDYSVRFWVHGEELREAYFMPWEMEIHKGDKVDIGFKS